MFTAATCYSYTQAFIQRSPSFWLIFSAYGAFLFVLPPLHGVPHALAVYETLARAFAFLWLFSINEFMRNLVEHWYFAARVRIDALDPTTLMRLDDLSVYTERPTGDELPQLRLSPKSAKDGKQMPSVVQNVRENQNVVPVSWSVLRSAWLLTLPNAWITYACLFICIMAACRYANTWSRSSVYMIRCNAKESPEAKKPRTQRSSPPAVAAADLSAVENGHANGHVVNAPARRNPTPPPPLARPTSPLNATEIALNQSLAMLRAEKIAAAKMAAAAVNPLAPGGHLSVASAKNGAHPKTPINTLLHTQLPRNQAQRSKLNFNRRVAIAQQQQQQQILQFQKLKNAATAVARPASTE